MIDFAISRAAFRERYFEKAPHVFRGALRERPLAWSDLDAVLQFNEPTAQGLRLFNRGLVPEHDYTEDCSAFGLQRRRLNKVRFYGQLNAGATLVINRFELHSLPAQRLCNEVARFASQQTTSNAYVSFRGDGTFGRHWDTHDVFAIQLIGRKRWRVFQPTLPLPLSHQTSERSGHTCPDTPVLDCVLETGDVLYIPRGWWHHVIPLDTGSLHLSAGTYAPTAYDYLLWMCSKVLPQDPVARKALDASTPEILATVLASAREAASDPTLLAEFRQQMAQRERTTSEFNLGLFASPTMPLLNAQTEVHLNTCYQPVVPGPFVVNGAALELDRLSGQIVTLLSATGALTLAQLERQLSSVGADAIRTAVLNLNRYEIASLAAPAGSSTMQQLLEGRSC